MRPGETVIRRRALRINQDPKHPVYQLCLTADELLAIADISRVSRDEAGKLIGYQRPEVKRHVKNIIDYLDSGEVVFPNSIILALSSSVEFKEVRGPKVDEGVADAGTLEIALPKAGQAKPAWIVDGQQRALALTRCKRRDFPVPVNAFVADDVDLQKDQFLRINSTKPLPRGLITELLPDVSTVLPSHLAARKAPSKLCENLNRDPDSPFFGLIRRSSSNETEKSNAVVSDTAVIKMIQNSFSGEHGCLFPFRNLATGDTDFAGVHRVLLAYWNAVKATFPEAWGLPTTKSRLMHGAGILAMGRLMDRVMSRINPNDRRASALARQELATIKGYCRWTDGTWDEIGLRWNDIQNTPQHVKLLSSQLLRTYLDISKTAA